jgi:ribose transport system substrate-binding protein
VKTFQAAAAIAEGQKLIAKTKVVDAQGSAPQQASQIGNLVLQGWKAIVLDAASPTALNGVLKQACDAGIKVVVFDALATEPCAYKVSFDYKIMGADEAEFIGKKLNGQGNVLEIRGMAGTTDDDEIHQATIDGLKKFPGIHVVGSVHGNWTQTIAQKEVGGILPTLPKIDAVATQGGDGWGAYQAFKTAGRPIPTIVMGNRQDELALWTDLQKGAGGYDTFSVSSAPGIGSVAFWVAQQLLAGKEVPNKMIMPLLVIQGKDLSAWLASTPEGGVSTPVYSQAWTVGLIDASAAGRSVPDPVPPTAP